VNNHQRACHFWQALCFFDGVQLVGAAIRAAPKLAYGRELDFFRGLVVFKKCDELIDTFTLGPARLAGPTWTARLRFP
jgi:hypothetical protein